MEPESKEFAVVLKNNNNIYIIKWMLIAFLSVEIIVAFSVLHTNGR